MSESLNVEECSISLNLPVEDKENESPNALRSKLEQGAEAKDEMKVPSVDTSHMNHEELFDLGLSHGNTFMRSGKLEDINEAVEYLSHALASTPDGYPDLWRRHTSLGVAFTARYRRLGQKGDPEKSIEHFTLALALTPNGHPDLSRRYSDLGVSYSDRYHHLGQVEDLAKSIEQFTCAITLTPERHPDMPDRHTTLGISYGYQYSRLGQLEDLDKSIEHLSRALVLTPDDHPDLSDRHAALGVSYRNRYQRLSQMGDLEKSTEHKMCALTLTPDGHPSLSDRHASLGVAYEDRYRRLDRLDDLDKSTEYKLRALELTPDSHPALPDRHTNLGASFTDRYRRLDQLDDLEKSVEYCIRALALTSDYPSLPRRHADLGVCYEYRYERLGQLEDLKKMIEHGNCALALTPEDHPDLPSRYFDHAQSHWHLYQRTGDSSYLTRTLVSFRKACQNCTGSPRDKFQNALGWIELASTHSCLNPIEAYQAAIDLLPEFAWLGTTTHQRYHDLTTAEDLAISAASAAITHSDHRLALELLEHARCVVWNQTLMLRSPMDGLHSARPDLASRLHTTSQQLHDAGSVSSASRTSSSDLVDSEQIGKERRRLAKEHEDLLAEVRMHPGFEDFLRPMKADRLFCAARYGPVIVTNCHEDRCDALLISPGYDHVRHLPLPRFTQEKAKKARVDLETSLRNKGIRERGCRVRQAPGHHASISSVLLVLWTDVVKPVLKFLGYMEIVPANTLPHITWCPTGALSFLPLHAAGDYAQPQSRVFDYAISSYAPTLTALLAPVPNRCDRSTSVRVLAIGQQHTPGHTPLPGTAKELEYVAHHAQAIAEYSKLTGSEATTTDVLDAMDKHDWVHLACHAHQNVEDPTKSGFFLHDGTLDLAAINRRSFKNKGLAFLSACQTATGDEKLPDEAIHLASGMLMAGYPSVIATMWSVMDDDAPFVADKVYSQLMKDGRVGNGEAGRALHNAVAELREKVGEKGFARWVPYIHIGS